VDLCLRVWGLRACVTRPEIKVGRVSYDVIKPSDSNIVFRLEGEVAMLHQLDTARGLIAAQVFGNAPRAFCLVPRHRYGDGTPRSRAWRERSSWARRWYPSTLSLHLLRQGTGRQRS
jgi:CRISPR-associated Cas5-like protein